MTLLSLERDAAVARHFPLVTEALAEVAHPQIRTRGTLGGNLSHADAQALLAEHGFTLADTYADNHGVSWCHLDERNAEALLAWLGY